MRLTLFSLAVLVSLGSIVRVNAQEVSQVDGKSIGVSAGNSHPLSPGHLFYLLDRGGVRRGIIRIDQGADKPGTKATATLLLGRGEVGWRLEPRSVSIAARARGTRKENLRDPAQDGVSKALARQRANAERSNWNFLFDGYSIWTTWIRFEGQRRVAKTMSLGILGDYFAPPNTVVAYNYTGIGISGQWTFADDLFDNGYFVGAAGEYISESVRYLTYNATTSGFMTLGRGGYRWYFGDTFNISLAGSFAVSTLPKTEIKSGLAINRTYFSGERLGIEAMLGWKF